MMYKRALKYMKIPNVIISKTVRYSSTATSPTILHNLNHYVDLEERRNDVAFLDNSGTYTYGDLSSKSKIVAGGIKKLLGYSGNQPNKISFLCGNDSAYINILLGIWKAGHVAVPLCKTHPSQTLEYYVKDSESSAIVATRNLIDKVLPFCKDSQNHQLVAYEDIIQEKEENQPTVRPKNLCQNIYSLSH